MLRNWLEEVCELSPSGSKTHNLDKHQLIEDASYMIASFLDFRTLFGTFARVCKEWNYIANEHPAFQKGFSIQITNTKNIDLLDLKRFRQFIFSDLARRVTSFECLTTRSTRENRFIQAR